ncbi:MAG: membrane protein insertase YidC, partial [Pseudomonadota bacterium]
MSDHKNTILAIVLSLLVVVGWEYFFARPQLQKQAQQPQQEQTQPAPTRPAAPAGGVPPTSGAPAPSAPASQPQSRTRAAVLAAAPRVAIDTPRLAGSIDLKGARIDDLSLKQYHETSSPNSPPIVLLSPDGAPDSYYSEFGWLPASGAIEKVPGQDTVWTREGSGALTADHPVTLTYDNGEGLIFRRTISVDGQYLFGIKNEVENKSGKPVTLYPYALISRHGTPKTLGYYILHEGPIGVMGKDGLQEPSYKDIVSKKTESWDVTDAWLGFTDKYWAAVLLPATDAIVQARFTANKTGDAEDYQADYRGQQPLTVAPGGSGSADTRLFAGAKEISVVGINFPFGPGGYNQALHLNHFDLLIDWGWFYFLTKPMFLALDYFYRLVGNFGIAILIVTVLVKLLFFPLANKSYASMAKMKAVQPEMAMIKQRYGDDRAKQQQALMELYRKEKINPVAGCLPMVIQIPVFFSLYKVLFITIEMRHAPFYGWIHDLSAPDPYFILPIIYGLAYFLQAHVQPQITTDKMQQRLF